MIKKKQIYRKLGSSWDFSLSLSPSLSIAFWKSSTKLVKLKASGKKEHLHQGSVSYNYSIIMTYNILKLHIYIYNIINCTSYCWLGITILSHIKNLGSDRPPNPRKWPAGNSCARPSAADSQLWTTPDLVGSCLFFYNWESHGYSDTTSWIII